MKTAIIIQARMGSSRLPGKVLKKIAGKPLLDYQMERLQRSSSIDDIIIATTNNSLDIAILEYCQTRNIKCYSGSENDVLARYYEAATYFNVDCIVRITADCPIIDPHVVDSIVDYFHANQVNLHYVSNTLQRSFPRGLDTEVFSYQALSEAMCQAQLMEDREHVTPYIYRNPGRFRCANYLYSTDQSSHRWTVDTNEDFVLIEHIIQALYPSKPQFTLEDTLFLFEKYPQWKMINEHIKQQTH